MSAWLRLPLALLLVACAALAQAEPNFPALSGRVVDQAGMLDAATRTRLTQELASHEQATGNQLVVVTLPNLQGLPIEDFGYQLGRHWGIGQKGKDDGVLLLIARDERKIRIEVGYGLEGTLTDAQSSLIIQQVITPAFKQGHYSQGIGAGAQAILQVLGGEPLPEQPPATDKVSGWFMAIVMLLGMIIVVLMLGHLDVVIPFLLAANQGRGGGLGGGGGFGGGGGGFGGGGASGGW